MSFKILKVIFVILLLITLGEAGYYVYILKLGNSAQEMTQSGNQPSIFPQVTQTSLPTIQSLISSDTITYLQNMKYVKNKKIVVTIEESGYVDTIQIQPKGKATEIKLVDENGTMVTAIARDLEFWNANIFEKVANSDVPFRITDIKKGDLIMHSYQMNLTDNTDTHKFIVIPK